MAKSDVTFKRVFGEHKDLLISLLNSLLPLPLNYSIEEVEYLTPEIVPDLVSKKNSIVDVRCMEKSGREFIVEMQMYWTKDFLSRALFNTGKAYTIQAGAGFNYKDLKSVYTLCLINDMAFSEYSDDFYFDFVMADRQHPQLVIEGMEIVMVELPKYIKLRNISCASKEQNINQSHHQKINIKYT